eukprot:scaffold1465_cov383-Prasinococcus_capsulatus_cf.AAC.5
MTSGAPLSVLTTTASISTTPACSRTPAPSRRPPRHGSAHHRDDAAPSHTTRSPPPGPQGTLQRRARGQTLRANRIPLTHSRPRPDAQAKGPRAATSAAHLGPTQTREFWSRRTSPPECCCSWSVRPAVPNPVPRESSGSE